MTRHARLLLIPLLALTLQGCNLPPVLQQDVTALEARAASAIAKLKARISTFRQNLPQYVEEAKAYGQIVCGVNGLLGAAAVQLQQNVDEAPAKMTAAINDAKRYSAAVASACDRIAATQAAQPTGSSVADLALSAWNGYRAGKARLQDATVAAAQPSVVPSQQGTGQ